MGCGKNNVSTEEEIFSMREKAKDRIKELKISKCGFSLEEFYKNFDQRVASALSIGCELPEKYLLKLFADGCMDHRDLRSRALVHLEPQRIDNYSDLKIEYANLIKPKDESLEMGKQHFSRNGKKTGDVKCYNCGKSDISLETA